MSKPPYKVPTMAEIRGIPWNGFRVASTFSGAGGSCTGYRMAGFRVVWANEFVPAAQESYEANTTECSYLDKRDIRNIEPAEILERCELDRGGLDLFDGSPPCQAFSTAGKRDKGWGQKKKYEHGASQCNEELFFDYIRLLDGLQPKVFIAENVSGLVKGTAKGFFLEILDRLKKCGYRVECQLLDAQWLGVPQVRKRVIFQGVRNDLPFSPSFPKPLNYCYSLGDSVRHVESVVSGGVNLGPKVLEAWKNTPRGKTSKTYFSLARCDWGQPAPTIIGPSGTGLTHPDDPRRFTINELKAICSFPADFVLTGKYGQQWERLGNSVPPLMMRAIAEAVRDNILSKIGA